ncbi:MmgE/PrpD family protein [Marinomonas sp. C2222]|uniref:MmgE/PrpD family protein n=1 Tax=Marinomonas sargassi TaxID=2984494 RepID=A0ABT2YVG6_9GAMM|nr:MmgE/PrpD family protein [Marinomonas sargassi]MCV2403574.1 MmgE/PrpD family protein [Marinomonas sargassi]
MSDTQFVVKTLAEKIAQVDFHSFDLDTLQKTKSHILDTLGVALAGSVSSETSAVLKSMYPMNSGGSSIWGSKYLTDAKTAALVNAISAHALELDDSGGCDHSGAVVIPTALAVLADLPSPVTGQQLLTAIILGYEVGRRVLEATGSYESHNNQGWHSTGTCGVFGAATTAAVLMNLDIDEFSSALSIASSFAGGTWAFIHDGSQTKKLHAGRAAEGGVIAAKLAANGFSGPSAVFETNTWGSFLSCFNPDDSDSALLTNEFGKAWRINRCSIKPYATCRGTHSSIDALRGILDEQALTSSDVKNITVKISQFQFGMCGKKQISSRAEAQMSIAYALSAWLEFHSVGLDELDEERWSGDWFGDWFSKISFSVDGDMADDAEPEVSVTTINGAIMVKTVHYPLGSPQHPLSQKDIMDKYEKMSAVCISEEQTNALTQTVLSLELQADVRHLANLLASTNDMAMSH